MKKSENVTSGEFVKLDSKAHALCTKKTNYRSVTKEWLIFYHSNSWFIFVTIIRTCAYRVRVILLLCSVKYTYIKKCLHVCIGLCRNPHTLLCPSIYTK